MSSFIANSISFSKDFKFWNIKGGDNNILPRRNDWIRNIPIEDLFFELNGRMTQLRGSSEINFMVNYVVENNQPNFDFFHEYRENPNSKLVREFNEKFIEELKNIVKKPKTATKVIEVSGKHFGYIKKITSKKMYLTHDMDEAKRFGEYRTKHILKVLENSYSSKGTVI